MIADIACCLVIAASAFYAGYWRGRVVEHRLWMGSHESFMSSVGAIMESDEDEA